MRGEVSVFAEAAPAWMRKPIFKFDVDGEVGNGRVVRVPRAAKQPRHANNESDPRELAAIPRPFRRIAAQRHARHRGRDLRDGEQVSLVVDPLPAENQIDAEARSEHKQDEEAPHRQRTPPVAPWNISRGEVLQPLPRPHVVGADEQSHALALGERFPHRAGHFAPAAEHTFERAHVHQARACDFKTAFADESDVDPARLARCHGKSNVVRAHATKAGRILERDFRAFGRARDIGDIVHALPADPHKRDRIGRERSRAKEHADQARRSGRHASRFALGDDGEFQTHDRFARALGVGDGRAVRRTLRAQIESFPRNSARAAKLRVVRSGRDAPGEHVGPVGPEPVIGGRKLVEIAEARARRGDRDDAVPERLRHQRGRHQHDEQDAEQFLLGEPPHFGGEPARAADRGDAEECPDRGEREGVFRGERRHDDDFEELHQDGSDKQSKHHGRERSEREPGLVCC